MKVTLNGKPREIPSFWTVADLVADLRFQDRPIAVECNREILPRIRFGGTPLKEGDRIEIVTLVGGG